MFVFYMSPITSKRISLLSISLYDSNGYDRKMHFKCLTGVKLWLLLWLCMNDHLNTHRHTVIKTRKQCKGHLVLAAFCLHDAALTRQLTDPII